MDTMMLINYSLLFVSPTHSGCDNCNEWFHGHCINITEKTAKAIREWYCMRCRGDGENKSFFFFITAFKTVMVNIKYITNHQNKWAIVSLFSLSPDKDSSLEIKYRSKKNREKEADSERAEKQYSTPSTPDYKSERRRGSKVSYTSDLII